MKQPASFLAFPLDEIKWRRGHINWEHMAINILYLDGYTTCAMLKTWRARARDINSCIILQTFFLGSFLKFLVLRR